MKRRFLKKPSVWGAFLFLVLVVSALVFFFVVPQTVDATRNQSLGFQLRGPLPKSLQGLRIVDLHADTLLWDRDLLKRSSRGHVDLPRLQAGGSALQVFSVVTKVPRGINYQGNPADKGDSIFWLALAQRWPLQAWTGLLARALHQANRLESAALRSQGQLMIIRSRSDLEDLLSREPRPVGALLALEGVHALEGRLENLDLLELAGFRMLAPVHLFDNEVSGSQHGMKKGGLTDLGREWVRAMNEKQLIIDLAHASGASVDEVLRLSTRPIVVSHVGAEGLCSNNRNLTDDQIRKIAQGKGLIGVGLWEGALCGTDLGSFVKTVRYLISVGGVESVALGSDWDGFVTTLVDAEGAPALAEALLQDGLTESEVRAVMGENALRFFRENLPD